LHAQRGGNASKLLLFCSGACIAASVVLAGRSQAVGGGLLICGGIMLVLAARAGVAGAYAPPRMPSRNVHLITWLTVVMGCFFVLAGTALLLMA
jgi:hypothetical protein